MLRKNSYHLGYMLRKDSLKVMPPRFLAIFTNIYDIATHKLIFTLKSAEFKVTFVEQLTVINPIISKSATCLEIQLKVYYQLLV